MSYAQIAKTAGAKRYLDEREASDRSARRVSPAGARVLTESGLTCDEWLRRYLDQNSRSIKRPSNTESEHVEDGREVEGAQAAAVGAQEGVGDPPREEESRQLAGDSSDWLAEAYPQDQGADGRERQADGGGSVGGFDTPF
jgi:hypothetical protein